MIPSDTMMPFVIIAESSVTELHPSSKPSESSQPKAYGFWNLLIRSEPRAVVWPAVIPCDHAKAAPPPEEGGAGGVVGASSRNPPAVFEVRLGLTSFASLIAPSTFSSPAPCSNPFDPANGWAVYI